MSQFILMKSACRATRRDISEHSCEHQVNINVSTCGGRRLSGPKGQGHDGVNILVLKYTRALRQVAVLMLGQWPSDVPSKFRRTGTMEKYQILTGLFFASVCLSV